VFVELKAVVLTIENLMAKAKSITICIAMALSCVTTCAAAATVLELRCSYKSNGTIHFSNRVGYDLIQKRDEINDEGVDYLKITLGDNGYIRFENGKKIFSTKTNESAYKNWRKDEMVIKFSPTIDENTIWLKAEMEIPKIYQSKHGYQQTLETTEIDRVSGKYIAHTLTYSGKATPESEVKDYNKDYRDTRFSSDISSKGQCEKYSRKF